MKSAYIFNWNCIRARRPCSYAPCTVPSVPPSENGDVASSSASAQSLIETTPTRSITALVSAGCPLSLVSIKLSRCLAAHSSFTPYVRSTLSGNRLGVAPDTVTGIDKRYEAIVYKKGSKKAAWNKSSKPPVQKRTVSDILTDVTAAEDTTEPASKKRFEWDPFTTSALVSAVNTVPKRRSGHINWKSVVTEMKSQTSEVLTSAQAKSHYEYVSREKTQTTEISATMPDPLPLPSPPQSDGGNCNEATNTSAEPNTATSTRPRFIANRERWEPRHLKTAVVREAAPGDEYTREEIQAIEYVLQIPNVVQNGKVKWKIFKRMWDETVKMAVLERGSTINVYIRSQESLEEKVKYMRKK